MAVACRWGRYSGAGAMARASGWCTMPRGEGEGRVSDRPAAARQGRGGDGPRNATRRRSRWAPPGGTPGHAALGQPRRSQSKAGATAGPQAGGGLGAHRRASSIEVTDAWTHFDDPEVFRRTVPRDGLLPPAAPPLHDSRRRARGGTCARRLSRGAVPPNEPCADRRSGDGRGQQRETSGARAAWPVPGLPDRRTARRIAASRLTARRAGDRRVPRVTPLSRTREAETDRPRRPHAWSGCGAARWTASRGASTHVPGAHSLLDAEWRRGTVIGTPLAVALHVARAARSRACPLLRPGQSHRVAEQNRHG